MERGAVAMPTSPLPPPSALAPPEHGRRPLACPPVADEPEHAALCVSVSVDDPDIAVVTVSGRLIRQHALGLDGSLASAFARDHPIFVIDLGGVTSLDPTTLATITRRAALARRRGALITIVPPGAGRPQAA